MRIVRNTVATPTLCRPAPREIVGTSDAMHNVLRLIERVAPTDASVLLTGESGSGKELAASVIHDRSARRSGPFIALNCGAIPPSLTETELFGHEKGDSVGASRAHCGVFEKARGGTLLLDDVTAMSSEVQARLLRVLETKKYYPADAKVELLADVRVIASSNRCLSTAVKDGQLREDLFYRLAVFPIHLPPLRDRGDDVSLLAEHFLGELNARSRTQKRLSVTARMTLVQHPWPGNVRELKNSIERAFILGDQVLELAPPILSVAPPVTTDAALDGARLDIRVGSRIHDMERSLIEATLQYFQGNKRRAASALGCSLKTLYNKLNGYSQRQECVSN